MIIVIILICFLRQDLALCVDLNGLALGTLVQAGLGLALIPLPQLSKC